MPVFSPSRLSLAPARRVLLPATLLAGLLLLVWYQWSLPSALVAGLAALCLWLLLMMATSRRQCRRLEKECDRLFDFNSDLLCVLDLDGRLRRCNAAFEPVLGHAPADLHGTALMDLVHEEDVPATLAALRRLGSGATASVEIRCRQGDGRHKWLRWTLRPVMEEGWVHALAHDISRRKEAEQALHAEAALQATQERFEAVLDGLDAAVFVADPHRDEILFANHAFKRIHGFDVVGRAVRGVAVPQPERGDYRLDPRGLTPADVPCELFDGELQHPLSGRWYHVREQATRWVDGRVVCMGIATDITERKQTAEVARQQEERLQRTSRLITMGEMASTLAHELNQPLSAIANYCAGCVTRMQVGQWKPEEVLAAMQKASFQAERAGKIVRRVREFVKKSEPRRHSVNLTDILDDALGFADIDARRTGIRLLADIEPALPPLHADRIMIEQVVLNLIRNGLDAMRDALPEHRVLRIRARRHGDHAVEVAVIDRGHGLSEDSREQLFTPFFTTKSEGMGMGLNICRSIVEFHDGRLLVDENPEGGTIFSFTLPTESASERVPCSA